MYKRLKTISQEKVCTLLAYIIYHRHVLSGLEYIKTVVGNPKGCSNLATSIEMDVI